MRSKIPFVGEAIVLDDRITFKIEDYDVKHHVTFVESNIPGKRPLVVTPDLEGIVDEKFNIPDTLPEGQGTITVVFVEAGSNEHLVRYSFEF